MHAGHLWFFPLALLAATPSPTPASAGEAVPAVVPSSSSDVLTEVMDSHPELSFYEAELAAARAARRLAGGLGSPELSIQGGRKRVRETTGALAGEGVAWAVSITQTFEWPGRLALRKAIANRDIELAELGLARFRHALEGRARLLIYTVQVANEKAAAVEEVAARYEVLRETLLARDPAGITPQLETRVIEAQELALKRRLVEAQLAARSAQVELNQLRGLPVDTPTPAVTTEYVFHLPPSLDELLAAARERNFEFRMRQVELQQQGLEVSLARHERYPSISISPFFSQERAGDRESVAGVGVSLPLPILRRTSATQEMAEARRRQAEVTLLVAQRDLERAITTTYDTLIATLAAMEQWAPRASRTFQESAELADRHYRLAALPLGTYLELQGAYLDAVDAILDTKRDALEAGQQLQQLTGHDFNPIEHQP